jgi:hypothetical protein
MLIISDAFHALFGTKQREGENLQEYTKRFKTSKEILELHLGSPVILNKYIKAMPTYDPNNTTVVTGLISQTSEQLMAFIIYLENADLKKYGSVLTNLNSQKSLGNNQYPKTLIETNNVLGSHRFDANETHKKMGNQLVQGTRSR